jgi:hypothetical protein
VRWYRQHVLFPTEALDFESDDILGYFTSDEGWFWFSGVRIETTEYTSWSVVVIDDTDVPGLERRVAQFRYALASYPTHVGPVYDQNFHKDPAQTP